MNDERKPLVSDDIIIMHMHRANGDMDLCDRIRQEYEDLIASGKLRVVKEVDAIFTPLVPGTAGTVTINGGTNAAPTAASLVQRTALLGGGWTITTN